MISHLEQNNYVNAVANYYPHVGNMLISIVSSCNSAKRLFRPAFQYSSSIQDTYLPKVQRYVYPAVCVHNYGKMSKALSDALTKMHIYPW